MKLKYHRLKPGGVSPLVALCLVTKLKYYRLKPGGVFKQVQSTKIKNPSTTLANTLQS